MRKFTLDDAPGFYALSADPAVVRYTGQAPFASLAEATEALKSKPLRDYRERGFGRLACIEKTTGHLVGFCGLKFVPEIKEVDIGYRFLPAYWGRGLATESAQAVMLYGRGEMGLQRIVGLVQPENSGSVRVLKKVGMQFERQVDLTPEETGLHLYAN
nr:GNAT family N-acetyltransferase [Microbulbifer sediminum]